MNRIALIGGGEFEQAFDDFHIAIFEQFGFRNPKITYFPTAAARDGEDRVRYWTNVAVQRLTYVGSRPSPAMVLNKNAANDSENVQLVENADIIYLGGGLPQVYIEILSNSLVWQKIALAIRSGKPLIAASAGAMILGEICLVDEYPGDYPPSKWSQGFSVLEGIGIAPHFDTFPSAWIEKIKMTLPASKTLFGIDEATAILLNDDKEIILGNGKVIKYKK